MLSESARRTTPARVVCGVLCAHLLPTSVLWLGYGDRHPLEGLVGAWLFGAFFAWPWVLPALLAWAVLHWTRWATWWTAALVGLADGLVFGHLMASFVFPGLHLDPASRLAITGALGATTGLCVWAAAYGRRGARKLERNLTHPSPGRTN